MTNGIAFGLGVGVGSLTTMISLTIAVWLVIFWRRK